jgi:hypothetical protein
LAVAFTIAAAGSAAGAGAADAGEPGRVPDRYRTVVLRLGAGRGPLLGNVLYEGNNLDMRAADTGPGGDVHGRVIAPLDGAEVAARWRRAAAAGSPIFVLRDALFSQQDHPIDQRPYALMLPPNWVTAAVAEVAAGRTPRPVAAPPAADDDAWQAIASPEALFGSFPASASLFQAARGDRRTATPAERARIDNARASVSALGADARAMIDAAPRGAAAVAAAGAERIGASDLRYFTAEQRRRAVVIAVENPNRHELEDEAKGVAIAGRAVPPDVIDLVRTTVYRRRLRDGDLAIERYNLADAGDRARALHVLATLIPRGHAPPGHDVWLWVNGGLDARGTSGHDAAPFVEAFRRQLARADVDLARVRLFSKPSVKLPSGAALRPAFEAAVDRYRALELPLSVTFDGRTLQRLLAAPAP